MKALSLFLALVVVPCSASAQGTAACDALLNHGIYNISSTSSSASTIRIVHDDYCRVTYSSLSSQKQASFDIVVKKLPLGGRASAASSSETHERFCRDFASFTSDRSADDARILQIYDQALEAWRDCLQLALGGTVVTPSITPNQREVDFTLAVTSGAALFTGVDTTNMECFMDGRKLTSSENIPLTANAQSLRCSRNSQVTQLGNSPVDYFPDANVKVKTNTGDYRVDLYEMLDGPARDRFERMEAELLSLKNMLGESIASLGKDRGGQEFSVNGPRIGGPDKHLCPQGTFVSAIHASGSVTGKYGVDGISTITFTCSKITSEESPVIAR